MKNGIISNGIAPRIYVDLDLVLIEVPPTPLKEGFLKSLKSLFASRESRYMFNNVLLRELNSRKFTDNYNLIFFTRKYSEDDLQWLTDKLRNVVFYNFIVFLYDNMDFSNYDYDYLFTDNSVIIGSQQRAYSIRELRSVLCLT